jgi:hypothetical protein
MLGNKEVSNGLEHLTELFFGASDGFPAAIFSSGTPTLPNRKVCFYPATNKELITRGGSATVNEAGIDTEQVEHSKCD